MTLGALAAPRPDLEHASARNPPTTGYRRFVPQLNAIGIVASDMAESIRFYRLVGLDVPETPEESHVDAFLPNGLRFMLDTEETVRSFKREWRRETGNQIGLALECGSAAEVDEVYARATGAGFEGEKEP